jgi:hypothetical protein
MPMNAAASSSFMNFDLRATPRARVMVSDMARPLRSGFAAERLMGKKGEAWPRL